MQAFPLEQRESSFISPELPALKDSFDVTAVPLEKADHSALGKAAALIKTLASPLLYSETAKGFRKKGFSPKIFAYSLFVMWRAQTYAAYLKKNVFDGEEAIVYCYWYNEIALGALLLKKQFPNYKFITRCHGYDVYDFRVPGGYHPYKQYMDEKLEKVVFISNTTRRYYLDRYALPDCDKYVVHYLGVAPHQRDRTAPQDVLHLVSCSNAIPLKRVELIIEALASVKDFAVKWTHFGDGVSLENLKKLAAEKLGGSNISFRFAGYVPNSEYIDWVKENPVDLFITTSSTEGLPFTLMEAASFGIPCIATDVGGIPEIVSEENGTLLSADPTPEEVAQAITDFYHLSSEERKAKGDNSYKLWQNSFNSETNAQRIVEMLKQL